MSGSLSVHLLPASDGDCILVQAENDGELEASILIDGGRPRTYPIWKPLLDRLLSRRPTLDLVVVTHLDEDHIGGILEFLRDDANAIAISEIWFNGHAQVASVLATLREREAFSIKQADQLTQLVQRREIPLNASIGHDAVHGELDSPRAKIGPFEITVLTPSREKLAAMSGPWEAALRATVGSSEAATPAGLEKLGTSATDVRALAATPDVGDLAKPNGSSIGLQVSAFGRRLLFAADCHPDDLAAALERAHPLSTEPLAVDLFKVSHHGGRTSTSKRVLALLAAYVYAFSTDSSHRDHPDESVVAKVLTSTTAPKVLAFNYRTPLTEKWLNTELEEEFAYATSYPSSDEPGHLKLDFSEVL